LLKSQGSPPARLSVSTLSSLLLPLSVFFSVFTKLRMILSKNLNRLITNTYIFSNAFETGSKEQILFQKVQSVFSSNRFAILNGFQALATILTHTFHFFHCHQIPHTRSPDSDTFDLALLYNFTKLVKKCSPRSSPSSITTYMRLINLFCHLLSSILST
jgi:hypothetical protein